MTHEPSFADCWSETGGVRVRATDIAPGYFEIRIYSQDDLPGQKVNVAARIASYRAAQLGEVLARDLKAERDSLTAKLAVAREALVFARNELGVPQPGYPAPVANAAERISACLKELGEA